VHVLVVDDEPSILNLLEMVLTRFGAVAEVAGGADAIRALAEREFDLVISDTQMPEFDGIEVLETARRLRPRATRVLMSGDPASLARGEGPSSPAHYRLKKPVELGRLRHLVEVVALASSQLDDLLQSMRLRYADSADAVFVKDTRGRYLFISKKGASLLLHSVEEIEGRLDSEIFDKATLSEEVRASDQEVVRTRRHYLYVNVTRNPGTSRTFLSAKFPVFGAGGVILAIGCLSRDISELIGPAAGDRTGRIDELLHDLQEASSILASGANATAIERGDIERCLQEPREEEARALRRGQ
jgi:CheY-like chemotaxis protein